MLTPFFKLDNLVPTLGTKMTELTEERIFKYKFFDQFNVIET